MLKVGITGGIGSGKSTLCHILEGNGAPVYYADDEAKRIMRSDKNLRQSIIDTFGEDSYIGSQINSPYIAKKVFGDNAALAKLNGLVHPKVIADFNEWCSRQDSDYVIMECAIIFESGFDKHLDVTVGVMAPLPLRIERVVSRDSVSEDQVRSRIAAQMSDDELHKRVDHTVVNIFQEDLNGSALLLDRRFRSMSKQ